LQSIIDGNKLELFSGSCLTAPEKSVIIKGDIYIYILLKKIVASLQIGENHAFYVSAYITLNKKNNT